MANEFKVRKGLVVNGSGSVILDVQGSQGQLFSVTDQLSGSLFSVNDISGVPVLEAFSDSTVKIGQYLSEAIVVSGSTARITGSIAMAGFSSGSVLFAGPGGSISQNNASFFWDNVNGRLGINNSSPSERLEVNGVIRAWTSVQLGQFGSGVLNVSSFAKSATGADFFSFDNASGYTAANGTYYFLRLNNNISPTSGIAVFNQFLIQGTINQTGGANGITRGIYVNPTVTAAANFRSIEWSTNAATSPSQSWGLYGVGSAPNYLSGSLSIGSATNEGLSFQYSQDNTLGGLFASRIVSLASGVAYRDLFLVSRAVLFQQQGYINSLYISPNGNTVLNSLTDDGVNKLQISGSARITDGLVVTGSTTIVGNVSTGATLTIGSATSNAGSLKFFNSNVGIDRSGASGLLFRVGSNNIAATITSDRLVGIGTESPTTLLHVSGTTGGLLEVDSNTLANILYVSSSGNIGIGTNTPAFKFDLTTSDSQVANFSGTNVSTRLRINNTTTTPNVGVGLYANGTLKWSLASYGATSDFTFFNDAFGSDALFIKGNTNNVGIGTTNPNAKLDINGNAIVSGSLTVTQGITGSAAIISGSGTQRLTVVGSGSAQPLFTVQGSQGELFSIVDSLSGSLFSVNDQSGLPIMEVFSDNTILMGNYLDPMLLTTARTSSAAGINTLYTLPTSSYDAVYIDYTIRSGSNARAGNFMAMWSGTGVNFTDNSITEFGTTSGFIFGAHVSGSNMVVTGSSPTAGWTVKTIIKAI
jgi:hypothetical protein